MAGRGAVAEDLLGGEVSCLSDFVAVKTVFSQVWSKAKGGQTETEREIAYDNLVHRGHIHSEAAYSAQITA